MRRITCLTDCALALFCMLLWVPIAPAQARVQPGTIYVCNTSTMNPTIYRSGVFQVAPNTSLATIANAWDTHVRQTYHLGDVYLNSACADQFYDPTGQRFIQGLEQTAKVNKGQLVVMDWKYVPGQDTPPPPKAVAERTVLCYCAAYFGPNSENVAFSDNFEAPEGTDTNIVRDDFAKFVSEKYSAKAEGSCLKGDNNAKAKVEKEESASIWHRKIIETGWKPKTLPKVYSRH